MMEMADSERKFDAVWLLKPDEKEPAGPGLAVDVCPCGGV